MLLISRLTIVAVAMTFAATFNVPAWAQSFPNKPVRLINGSQPGSGNDTAARVVAQQLSKIWNQPVTVENRPGAAQELAAAAVARAPADGYTLAFITSSILASTLKTDGAFKLGRDLVPVRWVATGPVILVVNSAIPAKNVKELIEFSRTKPAGLNYGTAGVGSTGHLVGTLFSNLTGVKLTHIPYDGGAKSGVAAATGEVDVAFPAFSAMSLADAGKIRVLAVSSADRSVSHPGIPTIEESVKGCAKIDWYGLLAPAATPKAVLEQLYRDVAKAVEQPEVKTTLTALGLDIQNADQDVFAKLIKSDTEQFLQLAAEIGLKP